MLGRRTWVVLVTLALVGVAAAPADAQPRSEAKPDAPSGDVAQAESRFFAGQKLYGEEKYHDALAEFRASYELAPSPNSMLYVARCYRHLGQFASAYDAYAKVIAESSANKKYADTHKAATDEQAEVASKVGRIVVTVPEGTGAPRVRIGYRNIDSTLYDKELTIEAGKVSIHAEAPGRKPFDWEGMVAAGETQRVSIDLASEAAAVAPPDDKKKKDEPTGPGPIQPMRTLAYVSAGIGAVGIATFAIFGVEASSRYDDLVRQCAGRCGPARQDSVDAGRRETTASNVGLVVGIVGLGGGVALWLLSRPHAEQKKPEGDAPALSLRVDPDAQALLRDPAHASPRLTLGGAF